mgnify:CR=1 FL=1|jgi:hypothetical protein
MIAQNIFTVNNLYGLSGFYPPRMTFEQRTGYFSGLSTPTGTPFDGFLCYQIGNSGQNFMAVQSGMWKTLTLS